MAETKITTCIPHGMSTGVLADVTSFLSSRGVSLSSLKSCFVFPGFCDVHVHFREPGFSYKETVKTGCASAAAGGYTTVCTMPNLSPVPDSVENILQQFEIIKRDATIGVYPYGSITVKQEGKTLSDFKGMSPIAVAFTDDGKGIQDEGLMREAMLRAKELGMMIVAHCEDNSLLHAGYIHDGEYAKSHGHRGICSESEWRPIERDLKLVEETGCPYHVCHISAKESVSLIRDAKKSGINVTCETGPHYLVMDDSMLEEHGRFKMNPPIRSASDREALVEGIVDSTIDMIATDHAPHSAEEKSRGLEKSAFGVVGLETAFPVIYTKLIKTGVITLEKAIDLLYTNPIDRFGLPEDTGFSIWNLDEEYTVDPDKFKSLGRATPFEGNKLFGRCLCTVYKNKIVHNCINTQEV